MFNFNRLISKYLNIKYPTPNKFYVTQGVITDLHLKMKYLCLCFLMDSRYCHASLILTVGLSFGVSCLASLLGYGFYILFVETPEDIQMQIPIQKHNINVASQIIKTTPSNLAVTIEQDKYIEYPAVRDPVYVALAENLFDQDFDRNTFTKPIIDHSYIKEHTPIIDGSNKNRELTESFMKLPDLKKTLENDTNLTRNFKMFTSYFIEMIRVSADEVTNESLLELLNSSSNFYGDFIPKPEFSVDCGAREPSIPFDTAEAITLDEELKNNSLHQDFLKHRPEGRTQAEAFIFHHLPGVKSAYGRSIHHLEICESAQGKTTGEFIEYWKNKDKQEN